jgi:hypothetical protein
VRLAAAAVAVFAASSLLLFGATPDGDVTELSRYGHAVLDGQLPYRDFALEYPPGAIPLFTLPATGHFVTLFRLENALGWAIVLVLVALLLPYRTPDRLRNRLLLGAVALTPLALGPFALMRFDAWAAALALGALLALLRRRPTLALTLLALGTLVKVWPLALLPVAVLWGVPRRALVAFGGVLVAGLAPFVVVAHVGAYNAFAQQVNRHLQLESLGSSALLALGRPVRVFFDAGSWNVAGSGAEAIAKAQSLLQLAGVALVAWWFARSRRGPSELLAAAAATVVAVAVLGKVLSPQYLLWVAPFLPFVGVESAACFLVAAVLTRALFPGRYDALRALRDAPVALLVVRNVLLLALLALALRAAHPGTQKATQPTSSA